MKPGFALSLSFEGISLLHRAAGGWRTVGDVSLENPDMGAALTKLRDNALLLSPSGVTCKLIIPNDQIRYLTVETGGAEDGLRTEMVLAALDGATPYPVADLAFDISVEGEMTHVAAVARETLAEAESFAVENDFHPVCFVAVPGDNLFLGEPHFGPTSHAAELLGDERAEPDRVAVVIIGMANIPKPVPIAPPKSEPEAPEMAGFSSRRRKPDDPKLVSAVDPVIKPEPTPVVETAADPEPTVKNAGPALAGATRGTGLPTLPSIPPPSLEPATRAVVKPVVVPVTITAVAPPPEEPLTTRIDTPTRTATEDAPAKKESFLKRRKARKVAAVAVPSPSTAPAKSLKTNPIQTADMNETQRMTVFGARTEQSVGGKPRYLGLILTAVLLLFLAGIAAWASLFMDTKLSRWLFLNPDETELAAEPEPIAESPFTSGPQPKLQIADAPETTTLEIIPAPQAEGIELASLPPTDIETSNIATTGLTDTDAAVLDALREPEQPSAPTAVDDRPLYVVTGIVPNAPPRLETPAVIGLDDLYIVSIDRTDLSHDAVALPSLASLQTDISLATLSTPLAAETEFSLNAQGLVIATAAGAVSPDGIIVYLGQPPIRPPAPPERFDHQAEQDDVQIHLAGLRPLARPADLKDHTERATLGGRTRAELGQLRPLLRPDFPVVEQTPEDDGSNSIFAARKPLIRPGDLARSPQTGGSGGIEPALGSVGVQVATIAPRTVKPSVPSSASVARQATMDNAINLRKINLIGVYGTPANRRALVRLPSGRYKKIKVGDRIDGGRVLAISDSELRYQKGNRSTTLKIPSS